MCIARTRHAAGVDESDDFDAVIAALRQWSTIISARFVSWPMCSFLLSSSLVFVVDFIDSNTNCTVHRRSHSCSTVN